VEIPGNEDGGEIFPRKGMGTLDGGDGERCSHPASFKFVEQVPS
jgi:hypothetical protein